MPRKVIPLKQPLSFAVQASEVAQHIGELQKHILKGLSTSISGSPDSVSATLWFMGDAVAALEKLTPLVRQLEKQAVTAYEESKKKKGK